MILMGLKEKMGSKVKEEVGEKWQFPLSINYQDGFLLGFYPCFCKNLLSQQMW